MPEPGRPPVTRQIRIDHHSAVHLALAAARSLARRWGLTGALPEKAAVVASELATNLDKHARDGVLYIQPLPLGPGVEIVAADRGPGIGSLADAMADGYTTSGTLGTGLGAVRRIASDVQIRSGPEGTMVRARVVTAGDAEDARERVGAVCVAAEGEEACGDAWAVADTPAGRTLLLVDALGHGPAAAEAAAAALVPFHLDPGRPLPDLLTAQHAALRRTRGAAIALLRLVGRQVELSATGNVRLVLVGPDQHQPHIAGGT
uniref:ATP-binding protein n=1 Tax=Streptomyces sp. SBT349 TaxID=1580539 RepID=UPI00066E0914